MTEMTHASRLIAETVAVLPGSAAERFADHVAARYRANGTWQEMTYGEIGTAVHEIALGLVELGIEPGDRVCVLADTRLEWTLASYGISAAGAVVVPIYPTNSPHEVRMGGGQLAGARGRSARTTGRQPRSSRFAIGAARARARDRHRGRRRRHDACGSAARPWARSRSGRAHVTSGRCQRRMIRTRSSTRRGRQALRRASCSRTPTRCRCARSSRSSDSSTRRGHVPVPPARARASR